MGGKDAAVNSTLAAPVAEFPPLFTHPHPPLGGEVVYLWMTRKEICELLGVPPHTLYRMVQRGEVECNREGERLRYRPIQIDLDLAELEAEAERASGEPGIAELHRTRYLDALVALLDGLTERLVHAESSAARLSQARDDALSAARRASKESAGLLRQLNAYCQSLVESNTALHGSNAAVRQLRQQLVDLRGELLEVASSPLALPLRSRLVGMAQRADVG